MHLLDSDILSLLQSGHERVIANYAHCTDLVAIASINYAEVMRGRCERLLKAANPQELLSAQYWLEKSMTFLANFQMVPFDEGATQQFTRFDAIAAIRKIGRADVLIASVAVANSAILVSRNRRHFAVVPGLTVVNWAD